jgi:hypothetical protein
MMKSTLPKLGFGRLPPGIFAIVSILAASLATAHRAAAQTAGPYDVAVTFTLESPTTLTEEYTYYNDGSFGSPENFIGDWVYQSGGSGSSNFLNIAIGGTGNIENNLSFGPADSTLTVTTWGVNWYSGLVEDPATFDFSAPYGASTTTITGIQENDLNEGNVGGFIDSETLVIDAYTPPSSVPDAGSGAELLGMSCIILACFRKIFPRTAILRNI